MDSDNKINLILLMLVASVAIIVMLLSQNDLDYVNDSSNFVGNAAKDTTFGQTDDKLVKKKAMSDYNMLEDPSRLTERRGESFTVETFDEDCGLKFEVEDGYRFDQAAQAHVLSKNAEGQFRFFDVSFPGVYLTYKDTSGDKANSGYNCAFSLDGLHFEEERIEYDKKEDLPGIEITINGEKTYKRFQFETSLDDKIILRDYTSTNGEDYIKGDIVYEYDGLGSVGYYDYFLNEDGVIVLLFIGDIVLDSEHMLLATSEDNGLSFQTFDEDPLKDLGSASSGLNFRDPRFTFLSDGRVRLFTMVTGDPSPKLPGERATGRIYSHISVDGGYTWELEEGIRLSAADFGYNVWSLNDPHIIELPNGDFRMYVTALVEDSTTTYVSNGIEFEGYDEKLISAISTC